jgi:hypothetical protein
MCVLLQACGGVPNGMNAPVSYAVSFYNLP